MRRPIPLLCASLLAAFILAGGRQNIAIQAVQTPPAGFPIQGDEFVGPFATWTNVKAAYGAIGDGIADDTAALQAGLDGLDPETKPVLFLPPGTYRITSTLTFGNRIHVSVVGAAPEMVSISWAGPPGGTMLSIDGVAYSRVSRLTFQGNKTASAAIDQSFQGSNGHFDTGNEYADDRFMDVEYGIHGGFKGHGFAETSVVRARFIRNTKAGVALGNFNALDIWIWNSLFEDCAVGVTNAPGAGNYRVYDSVFRRSTTADLVMQNTGSFSARGNYSTGSNAFLVSLDPINHPAVVDIQRNTVVAPRQSTAIRILNQGPTLLLDNVMRSLPGALGPAVFWRSGTDADVASVGNSFTVANPLSVSGRLTSIDDVVVPASAAPAPEPPLAASEPAVPRHIVEVPTGADGQSIQQAIDRAVKLTGGRAIVHVPTGLHKVTQTIIVPPSDIQIVGDGGATVLKWEGTGAGPVLQIRGPTRVTLREFHVRGTAEADGIVVSNVDQTAARLHLEGLQVRYGVARNLIVNGLTRAKVELIDFGHAYVPASTSVEITGGTAGVEPAGYVAVFSGASAGNGLSYDVSKGARALVRDVWYEGPIKEGFARVRDAAFLTMQGIRAATPANAAPAFAIDNARGRTTLLSLHLDDRIQLSGQPSGETMALGLLREHQVTPLIERESTTGRLLIAHSRQRVQVQGTFSVGTLPLPNRGFAEPAFVRAMLADARAIVSPTPLTALPASVTDLRMFRVWVTEGRNNLVLAP